MSRGYILVIYSGGITGDVQTNDTSYHQPLKASYRNKEVQLMLTQLRDNPNKISIPARDDMMEMLMEACAEVKSKLDIQLAYKNFITNAFDGSEDALMSGKLYDLAGVEMSEFRNELENWQ